MEEAAAQARAPASEERCRFRGISNVTLDQRGRFALPTRYRNKIQERSAGSLVVTIDLVNPCVLVYPKPDYEALERQLMAMDNTEAPVRDAQRRLIGFATEMDLDGAGRVLVPGELRDFASIDRKGVLLGQMSKLELWGEALWQEIKQDWRNVEAEPSSTLRLKV